MTVLSYLLPGLREVRGPLIGGYLWLLALWLRFGDHVPTGDQIRDGSVWDHLSRLDGVVGAISVVAAVSIAAYLTGALVGELIDKGMAVAIGGDEHHISTVGESQPETKYLIDSTLRVYAESQLRFHVALPLVLVAIVLPSWQATLVTVVAAVLLAIHGVVLLLRTKARWALANSLSERKALNVDLAERGVREARVRVKVIRTEKGRNLVVSNEGPAIARAIDLSDDDGEAPSFIPSGFFPIDELRPGDAVDVPLAITFGTASRVRVSVRWLDGTGAVDDVFTLVLI